MTKKQFQNSKEPLVFIASVDPSTGKCLFDAYEWKTAESWLDDFERDFPNMLHFFTYNKAAINARRKYFGLEEHSTTQESPALKQQKEKL